MSITLSSLVEMLSPLQFSGSFLYNAVVFFVLAIVAYVAGARGVGGVSMNIAKSLVVIFVILAWISLVF